MENFTLTNNFLNLAHNFTADVYSGEGFNNFAALINDQLVITDATKILFLPKNNIHFLENKDQFKKEKYINYNFLRKYKDCEITIKDNSFIASLDSEMVDFCHRLENFPDTSKVEQDFNEFIKNGNICERTLTNIKNFIDELKKENKIRKLKKQPLIDKKRIVICFKSNRSKKSNTQETTGKIYFGDPELDEKFSNYKDVFYCLSNLRNPDFEICASLEKFYICLETMKKLSGVKKNEDLKIGFSINFREKFGMFKFLLKTGEKILLAPMKKPTNE